jgi:hypothetical protein
MTWGRSSQRRVRRLLLGLVVVAPLLATVGAIPSTASAVPNPGVEVPVSCTAHYEGSQTPAGGPGTTSFDLTMTGGPGSCSYFTVGVSVDCCSDSTSTNSGTLTGQFSD